MADDTLLHAPLGPGGEVSRWLACGPLLTRLQGLEGLIDPAGPAFGAGRRWILSYWAFSPASRRLKAAIYQRLPAPPLLPAPPVLGGAGPGGTSWRYVAVEADQLVDFSAFNFAPTHMQGWLHTRLICPAPLTCTAELLTIGPARVWLDGVEVAHPTEFSYVEPIVVPLLLTLPAGSHTLTLHGTMLGWREARLALGLRFTGAPPLTTALPLGEHAAAGWLEAEADFAQVAIPQFAIGAGPGTVRLSPRAPHPVTLAIEACAEQPAFLLREVHALALPCAQTTLTLAPGESAALPIPAALTEALVRLPEGHTITLTLRPAEGPPVSATRRVWANQGAYSAQPYGTYAERRREALEHLAGIRYDVQGSMAAVALGRAGTIDPEGVRLACHFLENRYDCADFFALSLLALLYRYGEHPVLRPADRDRVIQAFHGFKYWIDEPGLDGMCYITENHQILFHVTAYLAGQLWPDQVFSNSGLTGRQQMARARARLETWVLRRLQGGFSEWDSNTYLVMDVYAMLSLAEFARSARVRALATTLLHKLFFIIASQSFRGAHGSSHGRCYVEGLKSARADATSGLQRIAWGMGNFNGETFATGTLALAQRYQVPDLLQHIGADLPPELTTATHSAGRYRPQFDIHRGDWEVRTLTRRTPAAMLAAALDYRPGQRGIQEHLWQATLGPEAVVFTTYPGNSQEHGNARPNYWAGSARLPRVAMHGRTVICLYALDPAVGLGFSHAYFPAAAFDPVRIRGPWAFARRGEGYVALWGDGPLHLVDIGRHAGQELRSAHGGHAWVCAIGSAAEDGDWEAFCARLERQAVTFEAGRVQYQTPDGARLDFAWEGPLRVNGEPVDWQDFPHYANRYTHVPLGAETMVIQHDGAALTLDLRRGRVLESDRRAEGRPGG